MGHGSTSTSVRSNMFSLKLILFVCFLFVIELKASPEPKPKPKPNPKPWGHWGGGYGGPLGAGGRYGMMPCHPAKGHVDCPWDLWCLPASAGFNRRYVCQPWKGRNRSNRQICETSLDCPGGKVCWAHACGPIP